MLKTSAALFAASVVTLSLSVTVEAATGCVSGKIQFLQRQGQFCPNSATRNCTGAKYLQGEFNTLQGVKNIRIEVRTTAGATIGVGETNVSGNFFVNWSTSSGVPQARIRVVTQRGTSTNPRFRIQNSVGSTIVFDTFAQQLKSDCNAGSVAYGTFNWSNSPGYSQDIFNAYDGAWKMWNFSLSQAPLMQTDFNNVGIRVYQSGQTVPCLTSCADGPNKRIDLDLAAPMSPQPRVMHEMGHIAEFIAAQHKPPGNQDGNYSYPNTTPANSCWTLGGEATCGLGEWRSAAWAEGVATFFGDLALYDFTATQPHTCGPLDSSPCADGDNAQQDSWNTENVSNSGDVDHLVINVVRYLWDIYDDRAETSFVCGSTPCNCANRTDNLGRDQHEIFNVLRIYPNNNENRGRNEPWNGDLTSIVQRDGRSYQDFHFHMNSAANPAGVTDSTGPACLNALAPQ